MDRLKELLQILRFKNVKTYIQSGNIIFESKELDKIKLGHIIGKEIVKVFDFDVKVFIRTKNEMRDVTNGNPFKQKNLKYIYVTFLSDTEKLIKDLTHITDEDIEIKLINIILLKRKFIYSCHMVMEELS